MAKKRKLLSEMRDNPAGDWTIEDVLKLVRQEGLKSRKPNGGSHYVVFSPQLRDSLCVPHKRPIKARYIRMLVSYVEAHQVCARLGD